MSKFDGLDNLLNRFEAWSLLIYTLHPKPLFHQLAQRPDQHHVS